MDTQREKFKLIRPKLRDRRHKLERALKVKAPVLRAALDAQRQLSKELAEHIEQCRAAGGDCRQLRQCIGDACAGGV
jgi:hypothetical protein